MKEDVFGNIIYKGKIINVDKENIEELQKISDELKQKNKRLEELSEKIFNQ